MLLRYAAVLLILLLAVPATAASLTEAATGGDFYAKFRYRYEHVEDDLAPRNANASTLRSVIGYRSGEFTGFSVLLEGEQVSRIGGHYREYPGQPGNSYAVVPDPDSTELNQGYLQYQVSNNRVRVGRQIITYRDAPLHRFIGTVLWRQNWQTFDAVSLENTSLDHTRLSYAWIGRVNRIFGDNTPGALSHFNSNSHLFNLKYDRFDVVNLEVYAYLLDFDNAPAASSATFGLRLDGEYPLSNSLTAVYALEYAHQADYGDNPAGYNAGYQLVQGGIRVKPAGLLDTVTIKGSFERLGGNGRSAFQTPLGTNHAFQGTADRFLSTPADGILDYYFTLQTSLHGFKLAAAYHILDSDKFDYRYGEEFDIQLTRKLGARYELGIKYADYHAEGNAVSLARNGTSTVTADARKFWVFATASF
jgi:hypothetical protein